MKVAIYVRVSTQEQAKEGFSIPAQIESLRAFCKSQSWEIVEEYKEEGKSAKDLDRPKMKKMMSDIKKRKFDLVLVHKLDRLTRSVSDLYELLEYFEKYDVKFRSSTEQYDTTTALGKLFITLVASLAQWERENLAERVKFGIHQMIEEGKRPGGHSPYGYKFEKNFECEIIEEEAKWVKKIFDWYVDGFGYRKISDRLNELKIKPRIANEWNHNTVYGMLRNDIYIGVYRWGEKVVYNNHPAVVSNSLFAKAQQKIKSNHKNLARKGKFPLTGILECGHCNKPMSGLFDKRDNKTYYRCFNCNRSTDGKKITDLLLDEIEKLITSKDYFLKQIDKNYQPQAINVKEVKKKLEVINQQKEKWYSLFLDERNPIPKETLYSKINELNDQEEELKNILLEAEIEEESPEEKYKKLSRIKDIHFVYNEADPFEQKELLQSIFECLTIKRAVGRNMPITLNYKLN
ncbi:recombinase family protein [Bacillus sp. FJAT-49705]|uniref:Recombinase family protein n=1 Tax=Cytobacillus citreus TaxID=2833586 RepID=A0ABS5NVD4_9BACI|nr:recombinase family protein [Cytobacillus citreus]MBS4191785.1 recombinase family protein [Cytobacillus citreus]